MNACSYNSLHAYHTIPAHTCMHDKESKGHPLFINSAIIDVYSYIANQLSYCIAIKFDMEI